MLFKTDGSLTWLQFELLSDIPGLSHGVFSRQGGVSKGPFEGLNGSVSVGDCLESVQENRYLAQQALKLPSLMAMNQVHGDEVLFVENLSAELSSCDGFMTKQSDLGLMAMHADCQIAIFYDPIERALAIVHAGWRGQVQNIYQKCIQKMLSYFRCKVDNLLVCISPSLGPCHSKFRNYQSELPQEFWAFEETFQHFNLWNVARYQLEQAGVLPHHIEIAQICTYANSADYFSYRRDQLTGRNITLAGLTSSS